MNKKLMIFFGGLIILVLIFIFGFNVLKNNKDSLKQDDIQTQINEQDNGKKEIKEVNVSYVTRSISKKNIKSNEVVEVTLDVYVNVELETDEEGVSFAIISENISELISSGWEITDSASGTLSEETLSWIFFTSNPYNKLKPHYEIPYKLQAPSTLGEYNFNGFYIFSNSTQYDENGDPLLGNTQGQSTITVA